MSNLVYDKKCIVCGNAFQCKKSNAMYCSSPCRVWSCTHGTPLAGPYRLKRVIVRRYEPFVYPL